MKRRNPACWNAATIKSEADIALINRALIGWAIASAKYATSGKSEGRTIRALG